MLAVAFEGCACRAAFHAGVAAALDERGLFFPLTAGASSGSLIAAGVAAGKARELPALWHSLGGRSIVSWQRALWNRSLFDMSHLVRTTLRRVLGPADLRQAPSEALITATRLRDLRRLVLSSREEGDLVDPLGGEWVVDGGLTDNLPIEALATRGAKEVIAVVTSPDGTSLKTPLRRKWRPAASGVRVHIICPSRPLAIRSWQLDRDHIARAIDEGYAQGRAFG
jgi:predicted acylesterase/phospholipase RssA